MSKKQSKGYKMLSQKEFDMIRVLVEAGLTSSKIEAVTGRSNATISYIKNNDTLEKYREYTRVINARSKAKQNAKKAQKEEPATTPVPTPQPTTEADDRAAQLLFEKIQDIYEVLGIINDKLDRVAVPSRRFGR